MKDHYEEHIAKQRKEKFDKQWFNAAFQLLDSEKKLKGKVHLDVGCGRGEFATRCHQEFGNKPIGIDISKLYVDNFNKKKGYKAYQVDLENDQIPVKDKSVDVVTCLEVIEHVFDTDHLLSEINRVLKPNGILVVTTPNIMQIRHRFEYLFKGIPPHKEGHHIRFFTKRRLEQYLYMNGFDFKKIHPFHVVIPFPFHTLFRLSGLMDMFPTLFYHRFCYKVVKKSVPMKLAENYWDELDNYDSKTKKLLQKRLRNAFDNEIISKLTYDQIKNYLNRK